MFERKIGKFSRTAELRLSRHGLIWTIFISRTIQGNEEFIFWKYSSSQRNFISQWEIILLAVELTKFRLFKWCVWRHWDRMFLYSFILCIFLHVSFLHFTAEASGEYPVLGDAAEVSRRGGEKSTTFPKGHQKPGRVVNESPSVCLFFFSSSIKFICSSSAGTLFVRSPFQAHLWSSVPPFHWLWTPDSSLGGSEFPRPVLHMSRECAQLCLTHEKWQSGQQR